MAGGEWKAAGGVELPRKRSLCTAHRRANTLALGESKPGLLLQGVGVENRRERGFYRV